MSGSELSTLESCLLVSDAPESVWRPAIHNLRMELERAHLDNISAFDLLSRVRMALGDNGKRMQSELIDYCRELSSGHSQRAVWHKVGESLPEEHTIVIVRDVNGKSHAAIRYTTSKNKLAWHLPIGALAPDRVTHWMTIPPVPKEML